MTDEFDAASSLFQAAVIEMLKIDSASALELVMGSFIAIQVEMLRRQGMDANCEIRIECGELRDVTIHRSKKGGLN